ncbi:hypothetical protein GCM10009636_05410 [Arthrobacter koreensis]
MPGIIRQTSAALASSQAVFPESMERLQSGCVPAVGPVRDLYVKEAETGGAARGRTAVLSVGAGVFQAAAHAR